MESSGSAISKKHKVFYITLLLLICIAYLYYVIYIADMTFEEIIGSILIIHILHSLWAARRANKARKKALACPEKIHNKWDLRLAIIVTLLLNGGLLALWAFISVTFALKLIISISIAYWVIYDSIQGGVEERGEIIMPPLRLILQWLRLREHIIMAIIMWGLLRQPEAALVVMLAESWSNEDLWKVVMKRYRNVMSERSDEI